MKITKQWLQEQNACTDGMNWFLKQRSSSLKTVVMKLLKEQHYEWANWGIVRLMSHTQSIAYAAFAAKQVLHLFEKKYPNDKRPCEAIKAALRFMEQPTLENQNAADAAAYAAYAAAYDAYAVNATNAAANAAAYAAANAAANAVNATNAAANATNTVNAANAAANAAYAVNAAANADAADAAYAAMKRKIVVYGLSLLKGK